MASGATRHLVGLVTIGLFLRLVACANGTDVTDLTADDTGGDAAPEGDATVPTDGPAGDAKRPVDAGCPDGHTGAACATCSSGFHACGTACLNAQPNAPEAGCALGCGTQCPSPASGYAVCSDAGTCDYGCPGGQVVDGGSCGCPDGQRICGDGACHACCSDNDCPNHVACNVAAGTCGGCAAAWGDCDGNATNGCETSLASDNDCGRCGNSCCTGFACGCGFLGLGGESCNRNGTSYSCGC